MKPIPILRQVAHESAGTVEAALTAAGRTFRYVDLFREASPALDVGEVPGLIIMGGPMNVDETDQYPFLALEVQWIQQALERNVPVLGICLGSQLLAKAAGARVYPMGRTPHGNQPLKEIGWYEIQLTPAAQQDPLFGGRAGANGQPPTLTVFQWHGDTFDLPAGAVPLAYGETCRHQAFRYGESAWGLQFHIEMTATMVEYWFGEQGNARELAALDYIDPTAILQRTPQEMPKLQSLAQDVLGRFARLCSGRE